MSFDELLERVWFCDAEVTKYDVLFGFKSRKTGERIRFHNANANEYQNFIDKYNPILIAYNCNNYDKYILKAILAGYTIDEIKNVNDYIIKGNNGWEIDMGYVESPTWWDLMQCIKTFKSLKELEGNLRLNITETTVDFNIDHPWTEKEYEEMVYYNDMDVDALEPIFEKLINRYKSKYIVCKFGNIDFEKGLAMTDANLTATLLGAKRKEHDDPFGYTYPDCVDKSKIPPQVLEYIDDLVEHNDLDYKRPAPSVMFGDMETQLGIGGQHSFKVEGTVYYDRGDVLKCG